MLITESKTENFSSKKVSISQISYGVNLVEYLTSGRDIDLSSQNLATYFADVIAGHSSGNTSVLMMPQFLYQIYFCKPLLIHSPMIHLSDNQQYVRHAKKLWLFFHQRERKN